MTVWLVCAIAGIGFAFDIYELLMLPLIIKPALASLGGLTPEGVPLHQPPAPQTPSCQSFANTGNPDVENTNAGLVASGVSGRPRSHSNRARCIWP